MAVASVGLAFLGASVLQHFVVRDPIILFYLMAIAVSSWRGKEGSGTLAFALSTIAILFHFLISERTWIRLTLYDIPSLFIYFVIVWWIRSFARSRHDLEELLRRNREDLEITVEKRTVELIRINAEYKTIFEAAPFGIVLLGLGWIVQHCNSAYERMVGYSSSELLGREAPLPEEERGAWDALEDVLRKGLPITEHEMTCLRRDVSRFSSTIWLTPSQDHLGNYVGAVMLILDNTKHKEDDARLRTSLEENRKLLEENRAFQERLQRENIIAGTESRIAE